MNQSHQDALEAEAIEILREGVASFEHPVLLYSVGKDSSVLAALARKAFAPAPIPFSLLHVDTGLKFPEMYAFREQFKRKFEAENPGAQLLVHRPEGEADPSQLGLARCCAEFKTQALLKALRQGGFDAAFGGARREEEKSRAKERVISFRDRLGQWDPRGQRPELWNLYNTHHAQGETARIFPLSNWTELDIWLYIQREKIPVVPLYFAKPRAVIRRGALLVLWDETMRKSGLTPETVWCRFRTLGCIPCTGAVESRATTLSDVIAEVAMAKDSERITRMIDYDREGSMERKKREGYF